MSPSWRWSLTAAVLYAVALVEIFAAHTWNGPVAFTVPVAAIALLPVALVPARTLTAVTVPTVTFSVVALTVGAPQSTAGIVAILLLGFSAGARLTAWRLAVASALVIVTPALVITHSSTGSAPPTVISAVFAVLLYTVPLALGLLVANRANAAAAARAAADAAQAQQTLLSALAVRDERDRVAARLQHVVADAVDVLRREAERGRQVVHTDPESAVAAFTSVEVTGQRALADMRLLLTAMRTADDAASLVPAPPLGALEELVASAAAAGLQPEVHVQGASRPLPETVEMVAYRVIEATLTDAVTDGAGGPAVVELAYTPDALVVRCTTARSKGAGVTPGLAGMRQRADLVGGSLIAAPQDDRFVVEATLPVPP